MANVELCPGPVRVEVDFTGGRSARIDRAVVVVRTREAGGLTRLPLTPVEVEELVGALWDPQVEATAHARSELHLRFAPGMEVDFPGGRVHIRGAACGPPDSLVLSGPLKVALGQATIRLTGGNRLRWLSSLAAVRVDRAVLHPDGRVALEGGARRGLDRAVRAGLQTASEALSGLVRHSPRFHALRCFLAG